MKIKKEEIMYELEECNYVQQWHRRLKEGLIGSLRAEYILKMNTNEEFFTGMPLFHAVVDMMVANIIHYALKELTEIIVNIIIEQQGAKEAKDDTR